jgi:ABC-2 type transport system permease protein
MSDLRPDARSGAREVGLMTAGVRSGLPGTAYLPISPWAGVGVLTIWAGGALLVGGLALWLPGV